MKKLIIFASLVIMSICCIVDAFPNIENCSHKAIKVKSVGLPTSLLADEVLIFEIKQIDDLKFLASYHDGLDINVYVPYSNEKRISCCYIQDSEGYIKSDTPCFGKTEDGEPKVEFCFHNINDKLEGRVVVILYDDDTIRGIIQSF